jgi:serine/threonine protein kinase
MTEPSGYDLETLWEDVEFVLSRGVRDGEPSPLLVVAPESAQPSPGSLTWLEHSYTIRDELDPAYAARPLSLVRDRGRPTLLLEDPGGEPLARLLWQPWEITSFLRVAIGLATALGRLHERGLIHKDVKLAHVLVDAATGGVWLTGFGIPSRLPRERQAPEPPEVIAGTLAYMAPEQTDRMNRSVDSRSDLYALGVTFYEMLTGALPFNAADPMGGVHCHIARQPTPPGERADGIPGPLSAIVLKLLAKTAEERDPAALGGGRLRDHSRLTGQAGQPHCQAGDAAELLEVERLEQVVEGALLHRLEGGGVGRGDEDDGDAVVGSIPDRRRAPESAMLIG